MHDQFFEPNFLPSTFLFGKDKWIPKLDISEGKKDITIKVEVPGIDAKDFDISLDGRILTIKGEKKAEQKENPGSRKSHHERRSYHLSDRNRLRHRLLPF